jgi:uncharacterized membrane protein
MTTILVSLFVLLFVYFTWIAMTIIRTRSTPPALSSQFEAE